MANQIRIQRLEAAIKSILSNTIIKEVDSQLAKKATITTVTLTQDLSFAKVKIDSFYLKETNKIVEHLNSMHSYFRRKLASELEIRKAPQLIFEEDKAIKRSLEIEKIIRDIENKEK